LRGESAGAQKDDTLHSGSEDYFRFVPFAGRQSTPLRGDVADVVSQVERRGLRILTHRSLLIK
jgi:hypothetical protein